MADRARIGGDTVLWGSCPASGGATLPYAAITQALRDHLRSVERERWPALLGPGRRELARLLPELAPGPTAGNGAGGAAGNGATAGPTSAATGDDRYGQARLFEAVLATVDRLQAAAPTILVIDDLQWSDAETRDLVALLARDLANRRLLVALLIRAEDARPGSPTRALLAEIARDEGAERIALDALDGSAVRAIAAGQGATPTGAELDDLVERTAGNPFLVEQLVAAGGGARAATGGLTGLADILGARLADLDEVGRRVVRGAAAAGRRVDDEILSAVLGLPIDVVDDALRSAIAKGILVDSDGPGPAGSLGVPPRTAAGRGVRGAAPWRA